MEGGWKQCSGLVGDCLGEVGGIKRDTLLPCALCAMCPVGTTVRPCGLLARR